MEMLEIHLRITAAIPSQQEIKTTMPCPVATVPRPSRVAGGMTSVLPATLMDCI